MSNSPRSRWYNQARRGFRSMHVQHSLPQSRGPAGVAPVLLTPLATPAPWPWACSATSALGCTEDEMPADFGASPPPSPVAAAVQTVLAATPRWAVPARRHPRLVPPPPRWSQDHPQFTRCDTKFSGVPTTSTTQRAYAPLTIARTFPNMRHKPGLLVPGIVLNRASLLALAC